MILVQTMPSWMDQCNQACCYVHLYPQAEYPAQLSPMPRLISKATRSVPVPCGQELLWVLRLEVKRPVHSTAVPGHRPMQLGHPDGGGQPAQEGSQLPQGEEETGLVGAWGPPWADGVMGGGRDSLGMPDFLMIAVDIHRHHRQPPV